ncbi:sensor histidine kinase [Corynebacterium sputi]|uniref:sensor histidine kinase n=1 Tax=Corynebacterium sputi TaxID=489915 RepID=UPI000478C4F4|nr:HAMP domain-containing sensor histidine kinase [Corynebacterium sputi]
MDNTRGFLDRQPLRRLLVIAVTVITFAGLVVSGIAVTLTMRTSLMDGVDDDLYAASADWVHRPAPSPDVFPQEPPNPDRPPSRFFVLRTDGSSTGAETVINDNDTSPDLGDPMELATSEPMTVPSVDGSSSWRIVAVDTADTGRMVLGIPLDDEVSGTVNRLILVQVIVSVPVLLLLAAGGTLLVRRSLRPLDEVETAAAGIASGDLSTRLPERPSGTEVGSLTESFNEMAEKVQTSFAEVAASEATARSSEERMRRFVADAGHELRTPLTSVVGFTDLHAQGAVPADFAFERIRGESARMSQLVEDLLTLAHFDEERPIEHGPVDLVTVIGDSVAATRAAHPDLDVEVRINSATQISGDSARLRQVLMNLLTNAAKYTQEGTHVEVTLDEDPQNASAVITVADDGPGMTQEQAATVFDRFVRLDESRTRSGDRAGGSGLGLSIVRGIVESHGGRVTLDTAPGQGCSFKIELPLN